MPVQIPWARNNCQYLLQTEVVKTPSRMRTVPMTKVCRK